MKDIAIELIGIGLYLLVMQHCLAAYVFEKPDESWLRMSWRWLRSRRSAWWDANVGALYNLSRVAEEPKPADAPGD